MRRIGVNAEDPLQSASLLRAIELPALGVGRHAVDVLYNGSSRASVEVTVERWTGATGGHVRVSATVPEDMKLGEQSAVDIRATASKKQGPLVVEQPLGAGLSADRASLDEQVASGALLTWESTPTGVRLALPSGGGNVRMKVDAVAAGKMTIPGTWAYVAREPEKRGNGADRVLVVHR